MASAFQTSETNYTFSRTDKCFIQNVTIVNMAVILIGGSSIMAYYLFKRIWAGYSRLRNHDDLYRSLYEREKEEKEEALRRLSHFMSDRLTDGNPNIVDLSDIRRPTRLAEEFTELYDNEWTDAFNALEKKRVEQRECITFLLDILQVSFNWCRNKTNRQFSDLKQLLIFSSGKETPGLKVNKVLMKSFKDERRRLATLAAAHVSEEVLLQLINHFKDGNLSRLTKLPEVSEYCKKCAELCWFFEVQDPPMDIQFNKGVVTNFKAYTKTGKTMDYIVWPPLFLHQNGSMMSKGVAQFYGED